MVDIVTGHAAHIAAVVLSAPPVEMSAITGVALKTTVVSPGSGFRCLQLGRIIYVVCSNSLFAIINVLSAIAVARLTVSGARVCQKPGALAVSFQEEGFHIRPVA